MKHQINNQIIQQIVDVLIRLSGSYPATYSEILSFLKLDEDAFNSDLLTMLKVFQDARKEIE